MTLSALRLSCYIRSFIAPFTYYYKLIVYNVNNNIKLFQSFFNFS